MRYFSRTRGVYLLLLSILFPSLQEDGVFVWGGNLAFSGDNPSNRVACGTALSPSDWKEGLGSYSEILDGTGPSVLQAIHSGSHKISVFGVFGAGKTMVLRYLESQLSSSMPEGQKVMASSVRSLKAHFRTSSKS